MVLAHVVHMECVALPRWAHVSHTWGPYMFCSQTDLLLTWAKYIGYPHANWQCHVVYTWVPIYKFTYACHIYGFGTCTHGTYGISMLGPYVAHH